ncbi:MAG: hypothetical protein UR84_C0024G0010 [candidate division WS6 bacterium GW2011_GWD1_35_594]|nr:MAG: hypothetical protein UR84_C0024G0010 [candidate division WS6 bacterium GW2011_GWD1_35_594]
MSNATIVTARGKVFDYLKPHSYEYDIYDISHSLSNICRFAGNTSAFYSVAQHSVIVARLVAALDPHLAKMAILHDAAEAFMNDMPSPLKKLFPGFSEIEDNILTAVFKHFDVEPTPDTVISKIVKHYDRAVGIAEMRDLFNGCNPYSDKLSCEAVEVPPICPLPPRVANELFLRVFFQICDGKFH